MNKLKNIAAFIIVNIAALSLALYYAFHIAPRFSHNEVMPAYYVVVDSVTAADTAKIREALR